jgi:hypothetical protein
MLGGYLSVQALTHSSRLMITESSGRGSCAPLDRLFSLGLAAPVAALSCTVPQGLP